MATTTGAKQVSKFDDTANDDVVECPYCGHTYQPEPEDYDDDEREEDCGECGKKYYLSQSYSVTHHARSDCTLNGVEHDYQVVDLNNGKQHSFCTVCGKCQPHRELLEQSK
jgi:hypothetical protein